MIDVAFDEVRAGPVRLELLKVDLYAVHISMTLAYIRLIYEHHSSLIQSVYASLARRLRSDPGAHGVSISIISELELGLGPFLSRG